ncbi:UvrD-helicase domain-containing protein [Streptomyces sp. NPDC054933]
MEPTEEQSAARDVFAAGRDLALVAGAGTGKTSTLMLMAASARSRRGLYVAFNRPIAQDAARRFGPNVVCKTSHALAFAALGFRYKARIDATARMPAKETARRMRITQSIGYGSKEIKPPQQARLIMGMVRSYCYSTVLEPGPQHLEAVTGLTAEEHEDLARSLLPLARRAWADIQRPDGALKFDHDHYMKMWALTRPKLAADFVLLDEAQDTNPVLEEIFLNQDAQRVCVGDPAQQIYAWRAAKDVMTGFPAERLHLTRSFRFGPAVAEEANRWLELADADMRLVGHTVDSRIGQTAAPDAVLVRTNADAMTEVMRYLDMGVKVGMTGGGAALKRLAEAAQQLQQGRKTSHPELFLFNTWEEVQDYAHYDKDGKDLLPLVNLVDTHGADVIISAVDRMWPEETARVVVSTAHKAKGREWNQVLIGPGFNDPGLDEEDHPRTIRLDEAKLVYVAVTRAKHVLDTGGVSWLDEYRQRMTDAGAADPARLLELPLTHQLKYRAAPVTAFMHEYVPNVQAVVRDFHARIRDLPQPVRPGRGRGVAWAELGHAIDYRIRLMLGSGLGDPVATGVAMMGGVEQVTFPGAPEPKVRDALALAGRELIATINQHQASGDLAGHEDLLNRLCFVAAFYERIFRSGRLGEGGLFEGATAHTRLSHLVEAVPPYVVADLAAQARIAEERFADLCALPKDKREVGPVFAGSGDIGGADADYILDGLLLDCKATVHPRTIGEAEFWQLAGYLLLDYDDRFGIDRVGLYLSRQGGLITWSVPEFLTKLGTSTTLAELRAEFEKKLTKAQESSTLAPESEPPSGGGS